jgi:hypothetical protein
MASRRLRAIQLLAAERVGANDLELERAKSRRDAQTQGATLNALDTLAQTAVKGGAAFNDAREDSTTKGATRAAAAYKGNVGMTKAPKLGEDGKPIPGQATEYDFSPEIEAKTALAGNKLYEVKEKTGDPLKDFFSDPFDYRRSTTQLERRKAEQLTAAEIAEARREQKKIDAARGEKAEQRGFEKGEHVLDRDVKREGYKNEAENRRQTNELAISALTGRREDAKATLEARREETKLEDERARQEIDRKRAKDKQDAEDSKADREMKQSQAAERSKIEHEKLRLLEQRVRAQVGKQKGLSDAAKKDRAHMLLTLEALDELRKAKSRVSTGLWNTAKNEARQASPWGHPDWQSFKEWNEAAFRFIGQTLEGGKLAKGDEDAYRKVILSPWKENDEEYARSIENAFKIARKNLELFDRQYTRDAVNVDEDIGTSPGTTPRAPSQDIDEGL